MAGSLVAYMVYGNGKFASDVCCWTLTMTPFARSRMAHSTAPGYAAGSVTGPVDAAVQTIAAGDTVRLPPNTQLPQ